LNERLRILKLLEEGKINAEEAARLLEALGSYESKERRSRRWGFMDIFSFLSDIPFIDGFRGANLEETLIASKKDRIELQSTGGNVKVFGEEIDSIKIEKNGFTKIREEGETLRIKSFGGSIKILTPPKTDLELKNIGGNVDIENLTGKIIMKVVGGNIKGKGLSGSFSAFDAGGDIELDYKTVDKIDIKTAGDVILYLDENVAVEMELKAGGEIGCEFQLSKETRKDHYLRGILNEPKGRVRIESGGDITIKRRNGL